MNLQRSLNNHDQAWRNVFDVPESFERLTKKLEFFPDSYRDVGAVVATTWHHAVYMLKRGRRISRFDRPSQG